MFLGGKGGEEARGPHVLTIDLEDIESKDLELLEVGADDAFIGNPEVAEKPTRAQTLCLISMLGTVGGGGGEDSTMTSQALEGGDDRRGFWEVEAEPKPEPDVRREKKPKPRNSIEE